MPDGRRRPRSPAPSTRVAPRRLRAERAPGGHFSRGARGGEQGRLRRVLEVADAGERTDRVGGAAGGESGAERLERLGCRAGQEGTEILLGVDRRASAGGE